MARPTRLDIEGGWYHVLNRGIEKRVIFRGASGYQHFCGLIASLPQRFGVKVHGYVLMSNHYHLQVETPRANLSRAIQWLNVGYGIWFNRKYNRVGPLFQGRFKAILHDGASHGLTINKTFFRSVFDSEAITLIRVLLEEHANGPGVQALDGGWVFSGRFLRKSETVPA